MLMEEIILRKLVVWKGCIMIQKLIYLQMFYHQRIQVILTCQQCSDSQLVLSADNGTVDQNANGWLYPVYSVYNNLTDGCLTLRAQCDDIGQTWDKRYNPPRWASVFGPESAQLLFNYGTVQVPAENGVTHVDLKCKNGQWIYNNGGVDTQVNQIKCRFFNATSTSG
uniref:Cyanovirin-N domain-containing protein n=1 Tax=Acrobeloides nanus TaxID=290746 RepID=A0A914C9F4_9BILA